MKIKETVITLKEYVADNGKTFKRKSDNTIVGSHLVIGKDDIIFNYVEVDIEEGGNND